MWAAHGKKSEAIRILLEHGAPVNDRDADGKTALMYACDEPDYPSWGSPQECISRLLKAGAKLSIIDRQGLTATDYARKNNDSAILTYLRKQSKH